MNKATPIPDSIHRIANGSMEKATCLPCGGRITRAKFHGEDAWFAWWHVETGRTLCGEKGGK